VENPEKTNDGELVTTYACDARMADAEFLLSKRQYLSITGRDQGERDVIAYHTRQSFKRGEITPEMANKIGYELAMCFTKGKHAFIVATHVDRAHVHSHIIFNSTALDCTRKFRNFLGSARALRRLSDRICLENNLSIIQNPRHSSKHYGKWLGDKKPLSWREKLRSAIDATLIEKPADFDAFLLLLQDAGYEIKQGRHLSFRAPEQTRFTRLSSLGEKYSEQGIRQIIEGKISLSTIRSSYARYEPQHVNLLVDIHAKLQSGKGPSYERWAKVFNLKQMAQTLNYLTENNLLEYVDLEEKAAIATARFNQLSEQIKAIETRLAEIGNLKMHIINYSKTRDVYIAYRKAGYSKKFYEANTTDIILNKAAKAVFDALPGKKIPAIRELQTEYDKLISEKKRTYIEYNSARKEMKDMLTAKMNIDRLLGDSREQPEQRKEQGR
jgi:hypothetical protein